MNKNQKKYFSTGEFAKIVGVTKHTLFYYDKLEIFSPKIKEENEYRYYSAFQVEPFFVISALKELGMPLKEIKAYLDIRNPKELISLLNSQHKKIDKEINRLVAIKDLISQKIKTTQSLFNINDEKIFIIKEENELHFISSALPSLNYGNIPLSFANHMKCCTENNIISPFSVGQMLSLKNVKEANYNLYSFFYTKISVPLTEYNLYTKEEGNYLTAYHTTGHDSIGKTYLKILEFANKNTLILSDYFFEDVILDELSVSGYENFVIKTSILIKE
jgi:DNA-binding transcriptional MerR regulator